MADTHDLIVEDLQDLFPDPQDLMVEPQDGYLDDVFDVLDAHQHPAS
jgi:hypothetical protein